MANEAVMPVVLLVPLIAAASEVRSLEFVMDADKLTEAVPERVKLIVPVAVTPLNVAAFVATALMPMALAAEFIFVATCFALSAAVIDIADVVPPLDVVKVEVDALLTVFAFAVEEAATNAPSPVPSMTSL